jgi:hypothetical protein
MEVRTELELAAMRLLSACYDQDRGCFNSKVIDLRACRSAAGDDLGDWVITVQLVRVPADSIVVAKDMRN